MDDVGLGGIDQPSVIDVAFDFAGGEINVGFDEVTETERGVFFGATAAVKGVRQVFFRVAVNVAGDAVEVVVQTVHQRVAVIGRAAFFRQCCHFFDGGGIHTAEEVVVHAVVGVFLGKRRTQEAFTQRAFACGEVKVCSDAAILHFVQRHRLRADAVVLRLAFQIGIEALGSALLVCLLVRVLQAALYFGDEGTRAEVAVHGHRLDLTVVLIGERQVIVTEDAAGGVVVVFPHACLGIPFQFFTEGDAAATDADQAVGDVAGRLDFQVAVTGVFAVIRTVCPDEVFRAFATGFAVVVINAAGTRIPTFQCGPVFKGAVLGAPPDEVGAVFFLVFRLVARRTRFPDALVIEAQGEGIFLPAVIVRATEPAELTATLVLRVFPINFYELPTSGTTGDRGGGTFVTRIRGTVLCRAIAIDVYGLPRIIGIRLGSDDLPGGIGPFLFQIPLPGIGYRVLQRAYRLANTNGGKFFLIEIGMLVGILDAFGM